MAGVSDSVVFGTNIDLSGSTTVSGQLDADGKLLIGDTAGNPAAAVPTGDTNEISVTAGAGTLAVGISDDAVLPGTGAVIVPDGTTGEEPAATNGSIRYDTTTNRLRAVENGSWEDVITSGGGGGSLVQQIRSTTVATSNTAVDLPADDTIPQITEGAELMTLTITPTNGSNILMIEHVVNFGVAVTPQTTFAYFVDATANAIAAFGAADQDGLYETVSVGRHYLTAGSTTARTYRLRYGSPSGGTTYINQVAAGRLYGGVGVSTFIVSEISV